MADEIQEQSRPIILSHDYSGASRFFSVLGGFLCLCGGVSLATLSAVGENSMSEAIANGIGWYCIGRGLFMMATPFLSKGFTGET